MNAAPLSISVRAIADIVARMRGVPRDEMFVTRRRSVTVARAGQIVMWLALRHARKTSGEIGRIIGRDHSSVLRGAQAIETMRATDPDFASELIDIDARVKAVAETFSTGGTAVLEDVDADAVARRIAETPRGAIRVSVIEIEAMAAAVLVGEAMRASIIRLLEAQTIEQATHALNDVVEHVATEPDLPQAVEPTGAVHG